MAQTGTGPGFDWGGTLLVMEDDIEDFGAFEKNLLTAILDECGQVSGQLQAPLPR